MGRRKKPLLKGEFYHIYNRGNNKRNIFHDEEDYKRFLFILNLLNNKEGGRKFRDIELNLFSEKREPLVSISCYCLMPNHFHLIISEKEDELDLSKLEEENNREIKESNITTLMRKVMTSYVMYYNNKYEKTGSLFEGRFKSEHVGKDDYFRHLFLYIHMNPLKIILPKWEKTTENMKLAFDKLEEYKYSSLKAYTKNIDNFSVVDKSYYYPFFPDREMIKKLVIEQMTREIEEEKAEDELERNFKSREAFV